MIRTLARLTRWRGANRGANEGSNRATPSHSQPLSVQLNGISGDVQHRLATPQECLLILQRHFVIVRVSIVDVMRPSPDDLKVCGQQKIVRWPLASA